VQQASASSASRYKRNVAALLAANKIG